jgi:hypothetical protein
VAEARCWVLRNRARAYETLSVLGVWDCFFWVTVTLDWFWCGGWLGPALTKLLVGLLDGCVVSLDGGFSGVWWLWGWCSCPYFENCIVDASISL